MNYKMAYKAEMIARKLKKQSSIDLPAMMFHSLAYDILMAGAEAHYLTEEELKKCDEKAKKK